jgi:putative inorganic carbon (HCO3(-)) transporter
VIDVVARLLVRGEIVLLAMVYAYFVLTDGVPLIAFVLIALVWLARWRVTGALTRRTLFDVPILLLLVWLPVSFSVTIDPALSLPKVYGVLLSVAFFYAIVNAIRTRDDLATATVWLVVVCAGIALAGSIGTDWAQDKIVSASFIYDRLPRVIQGIPRSIAGGFARNGVGGTLAFTIPLLAALVTGDRRLPADDRRPPTADCANRKSKIANLLSFVLRPSSWVWLALALSLITLALTQSRGGMLGTLVGLLVVAVWRERKIAWLIGAGALGLVALAALGYGNALLEFVLRMDARNATLASRWEVWQRGVMMVRDFPYTGIGIGTYNTIAHLLYPFFIAAPDEVVPHAHNQFLQVAVDLGMPGLLAYLGLLGAFGISIGRAIATPSPTGGDGLTRALSIGLAAGMLAHHVFGLTDAFMLGTKPGIVMWAFFAFAAVLGRMTDDERRRMTNDERRNTRLPIADCRLPMILSIENRESKIANLLSCVCCPPPGFV